MSIFSRRRPTPSRTQKNARRLFESLESRLLLSTTITDVDGDQIVISTSIVAGVVDTNNNYFGQSDDDVIGGGPSIAQIGKITVKGAVLGSPIGGDHFGIVSHEIKSFSALGASALTAGPANDVTQLSLLTADVTLREL